jgi:Rieske Fe-S protein
MKSNSVETEEQLAGDASNPPFERRTVLRAAGLVGVTGAIGLGLAACGSSGSTPASSPGTAPAAGPTTAAPMSAAPATSAAGAAGSAAGTSLGSVSQIPVGGGKIFSAEQVVVTQPQAGTYKAFSSICTHMGCQVDQVTNGLIECPCHGSHYSIVNGAVQAGPAPMPLPGKTITVQGGQITLDS